MKESGIDWIGQIPEEWEVIKFKYLGDVKQGLTYSPSDIVDKDEGILVLRSGNIQNGVLDFTNNVYVKTKVAESIVLRKNDILITARNGSSALIGKNAIIDTDIKATFGAFMMVFRTNKSLIAKFAFYLMNISFNFYRTFFTTSTVNQLTATIFNGIEVPLPSISEQQKIADFLDKKTAQLDKVKSLLEEQIQKLKDYRASLIYETVTKGLDKTVPLKDSGIDWIGEVPQGWGVKAIKYIFDEIGSGSTPKSDNEIFYDGDINWIQSGDLYQTDTVMSVSKTISYQGFKSTSALKIYQPPFVALAMYGASVGNVAVSYIDACVNQAVVVMLGTSEKVRFGKYAIEASKNNLVFSAQGGTQPNISQNLIKNWSIPQPKNEEQEQIVDFLDKKTVQIEKLIQIKNQQIENVNKQRQTLIYDYVTGKSRV